MLYGGHACNLWGNDLKDLTAAPHCDDKDVLVYLNLATGVRGHARGLVSKALLDRLDGVQAYDSSWPVGLIS